MEIIAFIMVFMLGLSFGSFADCLAWRMKNGSSLLGRSNCPLCEKKLSWWENIPLLSYFLLRGRCSNCKRLIAWHYPAAEAVMALLFMFFFWLLLPSDGLLGSDVHFFLLLAVNWLAVFSFAVVFIFDSRFYLVSIPFTVFATGSLFVFDLALGFPWYLPLLTMSSAAIFFGVQFILTRGRGIGAGDIWLGLLMGAAFPDWELLILAVIISYILGSFTGIFLVVTGRKEWSSKLPLGSFLALGSLLTLAWGEKILAWYWSLVQL